MSPGLGELVDRLCITNLKLWHVQEKVMYAARTDQGLDPVTTKQLNELNLQRNKLMTALEECLAEAVKTGETPVDGRVKIPV